MENFGKQKQEKPKQRGGLMAGLAALGVASGVAMTGLPAEPAHAETITQKTMGDNSPNIVNNDGGTITIDMDGSGGDVHPNVSESGDGSIHQESRGAGSPNVIMDREKGILIINGKTYPMKK